MGDIGAAMSDGEVIEKYVSEAQRQRFWGSIELTFQDGQLALVRKEETIKIRTGNNRDAQQRQH